MVQDGTLREDLYHRINVVNIPEREKRRHPAIQQTILSQNILSIMINLLF